MYNESRKLEYIDKKKYENIGFEKLGIRMFNRISTMELKLGKDCSEFVASEIVEFYKGLYSVSVEALNVTNTLFKDYTSWCINNGYKKNKENYYAGMDSHHYLLECINKTVFNMSIIKKDDLDNYLIKLKNPADQALMLALFEGICGKEACELVNLCPTDFNKDGTVNLYGGKVISVSEQLKQYCLKSAETYDYYNINNRHIPLANIENVFKPADTSKIGITNRRTLYNRLMSIKEELGIPGLSIHSLLESGRLNYYISIINSTGMDISEVIEYYNIDDRYPKIQSVPMYLKKYAEFF